MSQLSDRLRYVNRVVGGFLVIVFLLLIIGLIMWTQRSEFFTTTERVPAQMGAKERDGIKIGTEVFYLGKKVGEVEELNPSEDGKEVQLILEISSEVKEKLSTEDPPNYEGHYIELRYRLAGAGEPYLDILPDADNFVDGPITFLRVKPEETPTKQVAASTDEIQKDFAKVQDDFSEIQQDFRLIRMEIQAMQASLTENMTQARLQVEKMQSDLHKLSVETQDTVIALRGDFNRIREDFDAVRVSAVVNFNKFGTASDKLASASEQLDKSTRELQVQLEASNDQLQDVLTNLQQVTPKLDPLVIRTQEVMDNMLDITQTVREETQDLPGTVRKTRATLDNTQELIETIQSNPLIAPHMHRPSYTPLISPSHVGP